VHFDRSGPSPRRARSEGAGHEPLCDALVCVGVVIRGQTPHFEYIAREAASGIRQVALESGVPATFG